MWKIARCRRLRAFSFIPGRIRTLQATRCLPDRHTRIKRDGGIQGITLLLAVSRATAHYRQFSCRNLLCDRERQEFNQPAPWDDLGIAGDQQKAIGFGQAPHAGRMGRRPAQGNPATGTCPVFDTDAAFARAIVTELANCYRCVIKSTKDLKLRNSLERLANYLLRHLEASNDAHNFTLDTEKRRLAAFLGMSAENLSRAFKSLQPYGVSIDGTRVTIHDPEDLRNFAKPSPLIDDYTT